MPQRDSISGPLFSIYFNHALQQLIEKVGKEPFRGINGLWTERIRSNLPDEMVYADDCDFITELDQKKKRIYQKVKTIQTNKNLLVNQGKTENANIRRKEMRNLVTGKM